MTRMGVHRNPPTRIQRRPLRGQLPLVLRPRERLAQRRRRARIRAVFLSFSFVVATVWGLGVLSYNEHLVINDVAVQGASAIDPRLVETTFETGMNDGAYHLFSRSNIFLYPRAQLTEKLLADLPGIKSVTISRKSLLAQAVTIAVTEREARYEWCNTDTCFLMDADGHIFSERIGSHEVQYTFTGGLASQESPIGQLFLRGRLSNMILLLQRLEAAGYAPNGATVENEKDFTIQLKNGPYLKVTFDSDAADIVHNLELILSSDGIKGKLDSLEYVDLRFGNRVYYQMK